MQHTQSFCDIVREDAVFHYHHTRGGDRGTLPLVPARRNPVHSNRSLGFDLQP